MTRFSRCGGSRGVSGIGAVAKHGATTERAFDSAPCGLGAVEAMDLTAFYAAYREDGRCRPAYEPSMMVTLLLYAYSRGTRSARAIERGCEEDVAYRVIAAQAKPDHATIARFVERHEQALAGLFGAVLGLCAK